MSELEAAQQAELDGQSDSNEGFFAIREKHTKDRDALVKKHEQRALRGHRRVALTLTVDHSHAKLALRQQYYEEITNTFRKLSPKAEMIAEYEKSAAAAKAEAD